MFEEKIELLKDTNPTAYEELIEFMPIQGYNPYKKDTLPSFLNKYLGVWQCPTGKHTWISTISYRANKESDPGCIICLNNKLGLVPKLIEQRLHYTNSNSRYILESLLYNNRTYAVYWKRERLNIYDFSTVQDEYTDIMFTLKELYPIIAEEWSDNNFATVDKIYPNDYCDYEFEWKCKKCGNLYKASFRTKRISEEYACPYCNGRLPFFHDSLASKFPKIAKKWVNSLNDYGPEQAFVSSKKWAYFMCPDCGVIYFNSTENEVKKEKCQFCMDGVTKQYSERLYKEALYDNGYLQVERYTSISWKCEECGNFFNASPFDRFHKKVFCPYCTGKLAISGKTSFKALYPEIESKLVKDELVNFDTDNILPTSYSYIRFNWHCAECGNTFKATISEQIEGKECVYCSTKSNSIYTFYRELIDREWKFQNNALLMNPRYELPSSKKRAWWICPICNNAYIYPINKRVKDFLRNRNSCTICKGRMRVKHRN